MHKHVRTAAKAWNNWWFRSAPPHALALFRISFFACYLFYWLLKCTRVATLFSDKGVIQPKEPHFFADLLYPILDAPPVWGAWVIYLLFLASITFVLAGAYTRKASILVALFSVYYWHLNTYQFNTAFDRVFLFYVFLFMCSQGGNALSYDMWKKHGSVYAWEPVRSVLAQRIIAVQLFILYVNSGLLKYRMPHWESGEVLWYNFTGNWGGWLGRFLARTVPWGNTWHVVTEVIKVSEIVLPCTFWVRWKYVRLVGMGLGILFHVLITFTVSIWWFMMIIPGYICFFSPEEVHTWLQKITNGKIPARAATS